MCTWRKHPRLQGKFDTERPDDIQVIIHDGHPILSGRTAELAWVTVLRGEGDVFEGRLLHAPSELHSVPEGAEILFVVPEGGDHPLQVTSEYLSTRRSWRLIAPCRQCGLTEMLSSAQELATRCFPNARSPDPCSGDAFNFTTRCGWCGGGMVVRIKRSRV